MTPEATAGLTAALGRLETSIKTRTPEENRQIEDELAMRKERAVNERVRSLIADGGFPLRHLRCTVDKSGPWGVKLEELTLKLGKGIILALVGTRGNGKTQLAVALAKRRIRATLKPAMFATATDFFMQIKSTYRKDSDRDESEVVGAFSAPELLILDEIGKRGGSEWENNLLFELLNRRYNDLRDTIVIDNRSMAEFADTIGPSLASRMNEGGGIVHCDWETFRK